MWWTPKAARMDASGMHGMRGRAVRFDLSMFGHQRRMNSGDMNSTIPPTAVLSTKWTTWWVGGWGGWVGVSGRVGLGRSVCGAGTR